MKTTAGLLLAASHISTNAPYFFLIGMLFWKDRRGSKCRTILSLAALLITHGLSSLILMTLIGPGSWTHIQFAFFCVGVLALLMWLFNISFSKALYSFLLIRAVYITVNYIALNAFMLARPGEYIGFDNEPLYTLAVLLGTGCIFPFLRRFFIGPLSSAFTELDTKTITQLCVAPLLFFVLDQCYSSIRNTLQYDSFQTAAIFLLILITGLAIYYINLRMVLDIAQYTRLVMEKEMKERTLAAENVALEHLNRMKTEFFQDMSHDIKTPLTVISTDILNATDLLDFEMNSKDMRQSLKNAQREIMRMARIVDKAMKFPSAQASRSYMELLDIAPLMRNCAETYRPAIERRGNKLTINIPDSLPKVNGNSDMMLQVLLNLLSNANRHTQNGEIIVLTSLINGAVSITVQDNGEGVKPEILPSIFNRGMSEGGTGFGLSICKSIIETHDGEISIESQYGKYTAVNFKLPVYTEQLREELKRG